MSAVKLTSEQPPSLRQKVGGSAGALVTDDVRRKAHANLQTLSGQAQETLTLRVCEMMQCVVERPQDLAQQLFRRAHDIRGVSGTFGLAALGEIADAICLYLDDLPSDREANFGLVNNLVRALQLALDPSRSSELARASAECRAAVRLVRVKEGRAPELS